MRWSYKTVHFGLKKDGLLGGAFLDDTEIEETLNEYGQGGWELISMVDTRDGVIAVFKQPLDLHSAQPTAAPPVREARSAVRPVVGSSVPRKRIYQPEPEPEEELLEEEEEYPIIDSYQDEPEAVDDKDEGDDQNSTIGSIRIE